jgi:hypothetical protein
LQKQQGTERPQQKVAGIIHEQKRMQKEMKEILSFNGVNLFAVTFTMVDVEGLLTILVLISALIYNLKKIGSDNG